MYVRDTIRVRFNCGFARNEGINKSSRLQGYSERMCAENYDK